MFNQLTWWDFIKYTLALAVLYYAYVLFKYYREDAREWFSRRGQPETNPTAEQAEEEEEEPGSRFVVNDYSDEDPIPSTSGQPQRSVQSAEWLPESVAPARTTYPESDDDDPELQGPGVKQENNPFGFPIMMQAENPTEQSIDDVRRAAERLTADEQGLVRPLDPEDKPAAKLAEVINQQKSNPLDSFAFTR